MNNAALNGATRYAGNQRDQACQATAVAERAPAIPAAMAQLEKTQTRTDELLTTLRVRLASVTELSPCGVEAKTEEPPPGLLGAIVTRVRWANDINHQLQQLIDGLQL